MKQVSVIASKAEKTKGILDSFYCLLTENNFRIVEDNPQLIFALGGDGTLLDAYQMMQKKQAKDSVYVGINSGTLGFLQDVSLEQLQDVLHYLRQTPSTEWRRKKINLLEIQIFLKDETSITKYAINDFFITSKKHHRGFHFTQYVNEIFLQTGMADDIFVCTPTGSTGHNKSFNGPIFFEETPLLNAWLVAPLSNVAYPDLITNPLIAKSFQFELVRDYDEVLVFCDGREIDLKEEKVVRVKCHIGNSINLLDYNQENKVKKVREKFIRN